MTTTLTTRQLEALEAVLEGQRPSARKYKGNRAQLYGSKWGSTTNMGGAVQRMVETLQAEGYLLAPARRRFADQLCVRFTDAPAMPAELAHDYGGLSVKGLETLDAHLRGGRRYDPTDTRLGAIKEQLAKRRELDAAYDTFVTQYRDTTNAMFQRKQDARRKSLLADARVALNRAGFDGDRLTDSEVLQLVRAFRDADHGTGYVRFLNDADLQAEADEAQAEQYSPGTIGDTHRTEKLDAMAAERERRAKQAA